MVKKSTSIKKRQSDQRRFSMIRADLLSAESLSVIERYKDLTQTNYKQDVLIGLLNNDERDKSIFRVKKHVF